MKRGQSLALLLLISFNTYAHKDCKLVGLPSGRDADVFSGYMNDAEHITEVAKNLGYSLPSQHQMYFVPSGDLAQLVANGRYALPHWNDGAKIISKLHQPSGVLEFVTKDSLVGHNSRSYYSDTTGLWEQRQVIEHVMGHNDFSLNSGFHLANKNDSMGESFELYEELAKLYKTHDHDEVSQWVQWLYSLEMLQNFYDGTHRDLEEKTQIEKTLELSKKDDEKNIDDDTRSGSLLRALVQKMADDVPWKREVAQRFEAMIRHYSGNVNTKIINEGWATFSQLLIHKHSKWVDNADAALDSAALFFGVAYPKLTNPYFVGVEAWKNIYKRFVKNLKKENLSELEKDRMFVKHAHDIIFWANSFAFIKHGLDEDWVVKRDLVLYREATGEEISKFCKQDYSCYPQYGEKAYVILSKNAKRIINYIARVNADIRSSFPQIDLKSINFEKRGVIRLEQRRGSENIPIELFSASQTLYIIAKMMEKAVELETFVLMGEKVQEIVLRVDAKGDVDYQIPGNQEVDTGPLKLGMKAAIDSYRADLQISQSHSDEKDRDFFAELGYKLTMEKLSSTYLEHEVRAASNFSGSSPSSGAAILEYQKLARLRFAKMLKMAVHGDIKSKKMGGAVRFRVLPIVPTFGYDRRAMSILAMKMPPAPVDDVDSLWNPEYVWGQDDLVQIGGMPNVLPGDIFKQKGNSGESEDSDDSEENDGDPDEGGDKPSSKEIDVPIKEWGKALAEELELPNLRRTEDGAGEIWVKQKLASVHKPQGDLILRKMVKNAMRLAVAQDIANDKEPFGNGGMVDLLSRGFSKIRPSDRVVKNTVFRPEESCKAVVVFVLDFSGSMQGKAHEIVTNFVFNFKALLLKTYEDAEFRFVVYDDKAREFPEADVVGAKPKFLGGSTNNVVGYQKARDILKTYDYAQWNKFLIGLADAGNSDGPETVKVIEEIYPQLQFGAFVHTENDFGYADQSFLAAVRDFAKNREFFGFTEVHDSTQEAIFSSLKELFPKRDKTQGY